MSNELVNAERTLGACVRRVEELEVAIAGCDAGDYASLVSELRRAKADLEHARDAVSLLTSV